tara:strand:+ start:2413 stop:3414 length:1002 start_codon:yes stop_codon:yes gene_type:complete
MEFTEQKLNILKKTAELLNLSSSKLKKTIYVYVPPKVGSTSLVSSLRIFANHIYNIIHIHDERMLKKFIGIGNISVIDLIHYTKHVLEHEVYVINIFRQPIERKMSVFFEQIDYFHFNTTSNNINMYSSNLLIKRFNNIFPHIGIGDWFIDKYNINTPKSFDFKNKYLHVIDNNIHYITIRLIDSKEWSTILYNIFKVYLQIIPDNEGSNKNIHYAYSRFKNIYKMPKNFIDYLKNDKALKFYTSKDEYDNYFEKWTKKSTTHVVNPYTEKEYILYTSITRENQMYDPIQHSHYRDEGCRCINCCKYRSILAQKIINGKFSGNEIISHNNIII